MAPQTRSATKPSPGRSTRNSVYGRPPPTPKTPKSSTGKSPAHAQAHDAEGKATPDVSDTKGTPWLACRDAYGVMTTVAMSETGEGIHVRWYYPDDDIEVDEDEDVSAPDSMTVGEERGVTPVTAEPSNTVRHPFPQTPMAPHPYDAGSVILTPVKKARPLQPSPPRIGDKGIRCLYEKGGVLRELNGGARIVLRHPVGSTANLSREQVECLEKEREEKIIRVQIEKLLAEKQRIEEEERLEGYSDSGYSDEMDTDPPSSQRGLRREGTNETFLTYKELPDIVPPVCPEETESVSNFFRGPNGELLDRHGRQMLGREGTILIDSTHALPRRVMRDSSPNHSGSEANGLHRARFGPEGTELID